MKYIGNQFFLSKKILNWHAFLEGGSVQANDWKKPYRILEHVQKILESNKSQFHLIDAITALKRSADHRIKDLNEKYRLKTINSHLRKKSMVERLSDLSIIKPLMLSKLFDIRNQLEHHDGEPPEYNKCLELLEFVWYFLRSTDYLSNLVNDSLLLYSEDILDSPYSLSLDMEIQKNWNITLRGWIQPDFFSHHPLDDFFAIELTQIETKKEFLSRYKKTYGYSIAKHHRNKNLEDLSITGKILDEDVRFKLVTKYFELIY
jgi:hypothetical protein